MADLREVVARAAETNHDRARKLADHRQGYHGMVAAITAALDEAEERGRRSGVEKAQEAIRGEYLDDPTDSEGDEAYEGARHPSYGEQWRINEAGRQELARLERR